MIFINNTQTDAKPTKDGEEGFTLIEMMVVLFIIMLLTAAVYFTVGSRRDKAVVIKAQSDIQRLSQALEMYRLDMMDYPPEDYGLEALVRLPNGLDNAEQYSRDGYISKLPDDPWGRAYLYRYPGEHGAFDIYTLGADGQEGGEGLNADITSWDQ